MKKSEAVELMAIIGTYWPNFAAGADVDLARATVDAWFRMVGEFDLVPVAAALEVIAGEGDRFAPPPGLVRRRLVEAMSPPIPTVDQAWGEVQREIAAGGWRETPTFSHPAIAETARAVGWRAICLSENPDTVRAHFRGFYAEAVERHRPDTAPAGARAILDGLRPAELGPAVRVVARGALSAVPDSISSADDQRVGR